MLFHTLEFAILFAVVWAVYLAVRHLALQNYALLAASYVFYGWWEWRYVPLLLFSTARLHHDALFGIWLTCGMIAYLEALNTRSVGRALLAGGLITFAMNLRYTGIVAPLLVALGQGYFLYILTRLEAPTSARGMSILRSVAARRRNWPFKPKEDGVYKLVENKDQETEWRWFCSSLEVAAVTRDHNGEAWGRLLIVTDRDDTKHEWAMPMKMLAADGATYREQLLSLGLEIAPGRFAKDALHEYIATAQPEERARCVPRTGWHANCRRQCKASFRISRII